MRALFYLKTSDVASARPDHECSQDLAHKIVSAKFARPIGRNTYQLLVEESWQWIKAQARAMVNGVSPEPIKSWTYQHHIEPKLNYLTNADSPWLRYLNGAA